MQQYGSMMMKKKLKIWGTLSLLAVLFGLGFFVFCDNPSPIDIDLKELCRYQSHDNGEFTRIVYSGEFSEKQWLEFCKKVKNTPIGGDLCNNTIIYNLDLHEINPEADKLKDIIAANDFCKSIEGGGRIRYSGLFNKKYEWAFFTIDY